MKNFIGLFLVLLMVFMTSTASACNKYKRTAGYKYLKNKEAEAVEYKKNLPAEEKIDVSNDVTQVNTIRRNFINKHNDIYKLKLSSKRYINRKKDDLDSFEEMTPSQDDKSL